MMNYVAILQKWEATLEHADVKQNLKRSLHTYLGNMQL